MAQVLFIAIFIMLILLAIVIIAKLKVCKKLYNSRGGILEDFQYEFQDCILSSSRKNQLVSNLFHSKS